MAQTQKVPIQLVFSADTTSVKTQVAQLKQDLNNLSLNNISGLDNTGSFRKEIYEAASAVNKLKSELNMATDDKGNFYLDRLSKAWSGNVDQLQQYKAQLHQLGPAGDKAFKQLCTSIASAEEPTRKLTGALGKFVKGFANTAMWTLQSNAIHGMMSAISGAISYAKELNKNLTNIRIVSGESAENMAQFAKYANKAAKELSSTTNEYVKSALIYYQQGLGDEEVKERTNTTMKMVNVTGEAASQVSSYMTAIWNNFDDGSKSLEYYGDVLAELGAKTASSSAEIAEGLETFASIGSTIGLSYEYAASALATIVATTRQSSSTVGNALKTIFSRLQGLKLGETLEDGTSLNKYSKALAAVGIDIIDQKGNLKEMDDILDEMGARWDTLSSKEQTALAQTVGGVRQYTNLISLMNNYKTFKENVGLAENSEGTLQKQQEIYEQSWEAASNRMRAAWETFYDQLINDKMIISFTDALTGILNIITKIIDAAGGLKVVLPLILQLVTKISNEALTNSWHNITRIVKETFNWKKVLEESEQLRNSARDELAHLATPSDEVANGLIDLEQHYQKVRNYLTDIQKAQQEANISDLRALSERLKKEQQIRDTKEEELNLVFGEAGAIGNVASAFMSTEGKTKDGQHRVDLERAVKYSTESNNVLHRINQLTDSEDWKFADISNLMKQVRNNKNLGIGQAKIFYDEVINKFTADVNDDDLTGLDREDVIVQRLKQYLTNFRNGMNEAINDAKEKVVNKVMNEENLTKEMIDLQNQINSLEVDIDSSSYIKKLVEKNNNNSSNLQAALFTKDGKYMRADEYDRLKKSGILNSYTSLKRDPNNNNKIAVNSQQKSSIVDKIQNYYDDSIDKAKELNRLQEEYNAKLKQETAYREQISQETDDIEIKTRERDNANANVYIDKQAAENAIKANTDSLHDTIDGQVSLGSILSSNIGQVSSLVMGLTTLATSISSISDTLTNLIENPSWDNIGSIIQTLVANAGSIAGTFFMMQNGVTGIANSFLTVNKEATSFMGVALQAGDAVEAKVAAVGAAFTKAFGIISVVITALTVAYNIISEIIKKNSVEYKLERANQSLEEMNTLVNKLNTAYSDLQTTLNGFDDEYNKLNKMTKGSLEWQIAVKKLNDSMLELIKTYHLAYGDGGYIIDENQIINITEGGWKEMERQIKEQLEETTRIQLASTGVESMFNNQKQAKNQRDVLTDIMVTYGFQVLSASNDEIDDIGNLEDSFKALLKTGLSPEELIKINTEELDKFDILSDTEKSILKALKQVLNKMPDEISGAYDSYINYELAKTEGIIPDAVSKLTADTNIASQLNDLNNLDNKSVTQALAQDIANEVENTWEKEDVSKDEAKTWYAKNDPEAEPTDEELKDKVNELKYAKAYEKAYTNQAEKFTNMAEDEKQAYIEKARQTAYWSEDQFKALASRSSGYGNSNLDASDVADYAQQLKKINPLLEENAELATEMAEANMNYNNGLKDLVDNQEEYFEALKATNKTTPEYAKALESVRNDLAQMLNLNAAQISDDFITNNLTTIQRAAEGDKKAIDTISAAWGKLRLQQLAAEEELSAEQRALLDDFIAHYDEYVAEVQNLPPGATIEDTEYYKKLDEMVQTGTVATNVLNSLFNSIGITVSSAIRTTSNAITWAQTQQMETAGKYDKTGKKISSLSKEDFMENGKEVTRQIQYATLTGVYGGNAASKISPSTVSSGSGSAGALKNLDDEIDRYHIILKQIEDLNEELDRLSKKKDRAFGQSKINLMKKEVAQYDELIKAQEEYIRQISDFLPKDKELLASYGAVFDSNGIVTNYYELIEQQMNKYNNSARGEDDEEAYENFKKALEQYEETADLLDQEKDQLTDLMNSRIDTLLEIVDYGVKFKIELDDDSLKYFDYLLESIEDDALKASNAIALMGQEAEKFIDKSKVYNEGITNLLKVRGASDGEIASILNGTADLSSITSKYVMEEKDVELLRDYIDGLIEVNKELTKLREDVYAKLNEVVDDFNDKIGRQLDIVSSLTNVLSHFKNIIDIVGKDTLGIDATFLKKLSDLNVENANKSLSITKAQLEQNKRALAEAIALREELLTTGTDEDIKLMDEQIAQLQATVNDSTEAWASSFEDAIQAIQEAFTQAVESATETFEKSMSGAFGNLSYLQDAYDKQKTLDDLTIDTYEKVYRLSKLNRDITNSIDNTDNIIGKQKLLELQEEINAAQTSTTAMTQYEVEFLEKKYQLQLAQIALEEAQNAKNQVRMSRDNEGNWGYVYTADNSAISDAQQSYDDKLFELEQLNQEYIETMQGQLIAAFAQYKEEVAQLNVTDTERAELLQAYWEELTLKYSEYLDGALADGQWITEEFNVLDHKLIDDFEETRLSHVMAIDNLMEVDEMFKQASQVMITEVIAAYQEFATNTEQTMSIAGTSVETFKDDFSEYMEDVKQDTSSAVESAWTLANNYSDAFSKAADAASSWAQSYSKTIDSIIASNNEAIKSLQALINAQATAGQGSGGTVATYTRGNSYPDTSSPSAGGGIKYQYKNNLYDTLVEAQSAARRDAANLGYSTGREKEAYYKQLAATIKTVSSYDTGGYTGEWGNSGKLAVLHQKEMVLNSTDTENFLSAINILRDITSAIDLNAQQQGMALGQAVANSVSNSALEQQVTIHAEFPNAVNHSEIEEAFNNLINRASQYAGRK